MNWERFSYSDGIFRGNAISTGNAILPQTMESLSTSIRPLVEAIGQHASRSFGVVEIVAAEELDAAGVAFGQLEERSVSSAPRWPPPPSHSLCGRPASGRRSRWCNLPASTPWRWALYQRMVMARRAFRVSSWWPVTWVSSSGFIASLFAGLKLEGMQDGSVFWLCHAEIYRMEKSSKSEISPISLSFFPKSLIWRDLQPPRRLVLCPCNRRVMRACSHVCASRSAPSALDRSKMRRPRLCGSDRANTRRHL